MIPTLILPRIAGLTTLLIILGFIWFATPSLEINGTTPFVAVYVRLILCSLMILTMMLVMVIERLISKQKQSAEEQAQKAEVQKQKLAYKQAMRQATVKLRNIFPLWQWRKLRYLVRSPWYLILGDSSLSEAGLANTIELETPLQMLTSSTQPQTFTWHFSKKEVFVSATAAVANNWNLAASDPTWHAIARFIKRFRWFRPITGVIVTLSLPKLLQAEKALQAQQQVLTVSLQLLRRQFKTRVPVYLILTDCHQLAGFEEFFADFTKSNLEKPWGIRLPKQAFTDLLALQQYVEQEFSQLVQQLHGHLLACLEAEKNQQNRVKISYFPQQIGMAKSVLTELLPVPSNARLRGIYFIGDANRKPTYDFILQATNYKFGLLSQVAHSQSLYQKEYFLKRLLAEVVLPEAQWLRSGHRFNILSYRASYTLSILAILGALISLSASYTKNEENISLLSDNLSEYQRVETQTNFKGQNITAILPLLEVAKKIKNVYPSTTKQWLLDFELYEPFKIQASSKDVLNRTFTTQFLPRVAIQLESILQRAKGNQVNTELLYLALKGYLAFTHAAQAKPSWMVAPIIADNASHSALKPEEQSTIEDYLNLAAQNSLPALPLNHKLIEQAKNKLQNYPLAEFAYYELKQVAEELLPQLDVAAKVGNSFNQVFNYQGVKPTIPSLYTQQGYHQLYGKKGLELIQQTTDIYWVLGLKQGTSVKLLAQEMMPQLWTRYSRDYSYFWERLLANLHIAKVDSIQQMLGLLDTLTSNDSPLKGLLDLIASNTSTIKGSQLNISTTFAKLNSITQSNSKQQAVTYQIICKQLNAVKAYITTISNASDVAQASFVAANTYMQGADNPIKQLKLLAQRVPAPLSRWLDEIANNNIGLMLAGAYQVANSAWQATVLPAYQADIKGRYPFASNTDAIVSLNSFGEFFGVEGVIDQFTQTYVMPFIDTSKHPWKQQQFGNYSLNIAPKVLSTLEKAAMIQKLYFANGGKVPALQFAIQPRFLDGQAENVTLQYGNQSLIYRHDPQQAKNWNWPMPIEMQQASLAINDFNGHSYSRSLNGPWAWLQLFKNTKLEGTSGPGHYIWTITEANHQASFEIWTASNLPVFDSALFTDLQLASEL